MTPAQIRQNIVRSTLSSYLRIAVRMALGLVTFRLLFQSLSPEQFGFWSLLWAFFGYGILLDFGFGQAAQKRVAELSVRQDWLELSRVLSTILAAYAVSAAVAVLLGLAFADTLVGFFQISPGNRESFQQVLQVFLVGLGLAFPLGLFPDILQGQQRITTANAVALMSNLGNFCAVVSFVVFKLSFLTLVVLTLLCVLIPYLVAAGIALRRMPAVRLSPWLVSWSTLAETTRFSVYAYLSLLGNVLRTKADQPILGAILGAASVTPYQAGGKIGEMFGMLTRQLAEVLAPTAAHLHAHGDNPALRRMLVEGLRFSILAATPLYILTAAYLDGLIRLITGDPHPAPAVLWTGQILLLWNYGLTVTHWVFKKMYLMAGQERRMMWQGIAEAAANVSLAVSLTLAFRSIVAVALAALLPAVVFGWGLLWRWTAREAGVGRFDLARVVLLPAWFASLPMIVTVAALRLQPWWASGTTTPRMLTESSFAAIAGIAGVWYLGLFPAERHRIAARLRRQPIHLS